MSDQPVPRTARARAALKISVACVAGAVALALILHAPFVRRAALRYALTIVQRDYGMTLEAARLDYNLAALRVGLAGIRLSAPGSADEPFFEADYLSVTLPRGVLIGDIAFREITVTNARAFIHRGPDGTTNLPPAAEDSGADPPALRIGRLDVPRLAIEVRDEQTAFALQAPAIALLLTPDEGSVSLDMPAELRVDTRATRISRLAGQAAFDGRALRLRGVELRTDEASLALDGTFLLLAREPHIDLGVSGTGDVARLARWGLEDEELPQGKVVFEGMVTGPLGDPLAQLEMSTERLSWREVATTDLVVGMRVNAAGADVQTLRFGFSDGTVTAAASLPFASNATGRLTASWAGLNVASAARAVAPGVEPVPSALASGRLDIEGVLSDVSTWSGSLGLRIAPGRNARGRIAVAGNLTLELRDGMWRLEGQPTLAGVAPVRVAARGGLMDIPASPIAGAVRLEPTDVPALLAALRTTGLTSDVAADEAVTAGTLEANIDLGGSLDDPSINSRVMARDLAGPQLAIESIDAQVKGRPFQPRLDFSLEVPQAVVAGQALNDVRALGEVNGRSVALNALSASQPSGTGAVTGQGAYDLDTGEYTASFDGSEWQLTSTAEQPLGGRLAIHFAGSGTAAEPRGTGEVTLADAMWQDRSLGSIDAAVQLEGQTATIDARAPAFDAAAIARVQTDAPYVARVDGHAGRLELGRVLRSIETPVPVAGTTSLALRFEGPLDAWRTGSALLEVASLDATAGELPVRLARPARLRYEAERVLVDSIEADLGETHLSVAGELEAFEPAGATNLSRSVTGGLTPFAPFASGLLVTLTGGVGEVVRAAEATGLTEIPLAGGDGPVALLARVTGSLQAPMIVADLEVGPGSITLQDMPPVSGLRLRAHAEDGWLEVREGAASYQDADITVTGRAPLSWVTPAIGGAGGDAVVRARATNLTPAILVPFLDATTVAALAGTVDATLDATSATRDLAAVTGELRIDRLDLRLEDLPVTQRVPTRIVVRDGFARVEAWDWVGQGATLVVRGQVRLEDRQAAILANGIVDLRMLTPFVRAAGMSTAGRLEPRLSITGTLDNPRIDGDLTVTGAEIRLVDPRMMVSDLDVRTVLTRTTARITALSGTVNGGTLIGGGGLVYSPEEGLELQLSTTVRGMALEFPQGLRSEIDAGLDLTLDVIPQPSGRLSGTVTVVRGSYREPLAVVTGLLAGMRAQQVAGAGAAATQSPLLEALMLDVRLLTDEDIGVDNNYGRVQLGADLRLIGTAAAPALSGRADLREGGQLFVGRNVYTVSVGAIDFANPVAIEPLLNVEATTRAGGEDIEVTITGPAENPSVDLRSSSNPDLGQAEVASLLLTGRKLEDLDPGDAAFVGTQVLGNFSAEVLGFASRAVGLDTLRLGGPDAAAVRRDPTAVAAELDPTTRLTFGKSLGPDVDVTYSQSLRDSDAQTWIVDYAAARGLELRLVSDDNDLRSYGFRHDVAFGGPPRAVRAARSRQTQGSQVAAIRFSGETVLPESSLRGVLRLGPGDRFDFADWQTDRDRLEEVYRREGYLTARVAPSRSDGSDGVTLTYQVVAGPETRIVVTGTDLSPALRSRLETAWAQSVFDDFLVDEVEQIIRGELARDRYLRPVVEVRVLEEGSTKTLSVMVDPGRPSGRTVVRINGADEAMAREIAARLADRGLVDDAVSNPGAVERDVAEYLRTNGHLRARVTVGVPVFDDIEGGRGKGEGGTGEGGSVVVPVSVDAGPAFSITRIAFEGAKRIAEDALREAVALSEGVPYDPAAVGAARDRVIALYRLEGFPAVAVTVRQDIRSDTPVVDVTFVVTEGVRQMLREVVIVGNRAIDSDVIVRALGLSIDAPLRAEDLLRARTRVFETGLFRRIDVATEPTSPGPRGSEPTSPGRSAEADRPASTGLSGRIATRPGEGGAGDEQVVFLRLRVTVEEWPALRLRYGFVVAEERPEDKIEGRELVPGFAADVTRRTLFGRAISLGSVVALQRGHQTGRVFLSAPTLLGRGIESSMSVEDNRRQIGGTSRIDNRRGVALEQRVRPARRVQVSYAYRFERSVTEVPPDPFIGALPPVALNVARLTSSAAWDTRDDPSDTTRGLFAASTFELAPETLGSDIRFVRQLLQAYHFRLWHSAVLASAARVGIAVPLGEQDLILSERFFAGGSRTVRGVAEGGLGPRDFFGASGGRMMIVLNQEARLPIYKWVRGVAFVDAGNIFARPAAASLGDLVGSIGFGLRVASPFALLRADYGRPIWGAPAGSSGGWSFGIGHAF